MPETENKWICHHCVSEVYLSSEINRLGTSNDCDYCDEADIKCWQMSVLIERVIEVFDENYQLSDSEPDSYWAAMHHDKEGDYEWEREGEEMADILEGMLLVDREIVDDLIELWREGDGHSYDPRSGNDSEDRFDYEARFIEKPFNKHLLEARWNDMEQEIKHRSRFFSETAKSFLQHIFENIETLTGVHSAAITTLGDQDAIYRARIAWSWEEQKKIIASPQTELSSPPKALAKAGRMNAAGITVFTAL